MSRYLPALKRRQRMVLPMPNAELWLSSSGLTEFVRRDRLTVVLCEGGHKPAQVAHMARLLKSRDPLLAQDYPRQP